MVSKMPHLINGGSCTASTRQAACLARFAWMMQATPQRATCRFSLQLGDHKLPSRRNLCSSSGSLCLLRGFCTWTVGSPFFLTLPSPSHPLPPLSSILRVAAAEGGTRTGLGPHIRHSLLKNLPGCMIGAASATALLAFELCPTGCDAIRQSFWRRM